MASIRQTGNNSYRITVCCGSDVSGRKLNKYKSIKVDPKLTPRQREKEVQRQAVLFEDSIKKGTYADGEKITFGEFATRWFDNYAVKSLAVSTLPQYRLRLNKRVIPALGHYKLTELRPSHLEGFYHYLADNDVRLDIYYRPTAQTIELVKEIKTSMSKSELGITDKTFINLKKGGRVTPETAGKVCKRFNLQLDHAFTMEHRQGKLSTKTISLHHGLISTILSYAQRDNLIISNPAERVKAPRVKKAPKKFYNENQLEILFNALESAPMKYKAIVYLAVDTGLRVSELTGLELGHIDMERGVLQVAQQRQRVSKEFGDGSGIEIDDPKSDNGIRMLTLSPPVVEVLKEYLALLDGYRAKLGDAWVESPFVFRHETGAELAPSTPYQWFVGFTEKLGLPHLPFHGLRHPYVKPALKNSEFFKGAVAKQKIPRKSRRIIRSTSCDAHSICMQDEKPRKIALIFRGFPFQQPL